MAPYDITKDITEVETPSEEPENACVARVALCVKCV